MKISAKQILFLLTILSAAFIFIFPNYFYIGFVGFVVFGAGFLAVDKISSMVN